MKTDAKAGYYSNGADVKVGADFMTKHKNFTPVIGVEAKYLSEGNRDFSLITEFNNERFDNNLKYKEHQMYFNGKMGIQAQTNNKRLTFGMGLKMGYKAALDKGFIMRNEVHAQIKEPNTDDARDVSYVAEMGYKPES